MPAFPAYVLIEGTVYRHRVAGIGRSRQTDTYRRMSVPPGSTPGRRFKAPVTIVASDLPAHEVITQERAEEISRTSVEAWAERLRAAAGAS